MAFATLSNNDDLSLPFTFSFTPLSCCRIGEGNFVGFLCYYDFQRGTTVNTDESQTTFLDVSFIINTKDGERSLDDWNKVHKLFEAHPADLAALNRKRSELADHVKAWSDRRSKDEERHRNFSILERQVGDFIKSNRSSPENAPIMADWEEMKKKVIESLRKEQAAIPRPLLSRNRMSQDSPGLPGPQRRRRASVGLLTRPSAVRRNSSGPAVTSKEKGERGVQMEDRSRWDSHKRGRGD